MVLGRLEQQETWIFTVVSIFLVIQKGLFTTSLRDFAWSLARASNVFDMRSFDAFERNNNHNNQARNTKATDSSKKEKAKNQSETEHDSEHAPNRHRRSAKLYNPQDE